MTSTILRARTEDSAPARPRDRAMYLAALAVGLAVAQVDEDAACRELREAAGRRRADLVTARRRLYTTGLASGDHRTRAAKLLHLAAEPDPPVRPRRRNVLAA